MDSYSRIPATVELSNVAGPVTYGLAVIRKVAPGNFGFVLKRTFVVCPGAIRMVFVLNGFMYTASASTTVRLWFAILKKSSSFSAALIIRRRYDFPG